MVPNLRCRLGFHIIAAALALTVGVTAVSCTYNAATGRRQLDLIGEQREIAMGREYDKTVVLTYGLYPDQNLQAYVEDLGLRLAAKSERPALPWHFRVLDDDTVNAFAVPGGFIYITRGILAYFNSEAQLVTVLGHEIGHVTARHSVEQMSRAELAMIGVAVAEIASEDFRKYSPLAQLGLGVLFLKFSRDDESQADSLGLRYLVRAQYDPTEAPRVFEMLDRQARVAGQARLPQWQSTHPNPDRRAERLREKIAKLPPIQQHGTIEHEAYLRRLNGIVFGEDPREGYTVGSTFYHPGMAFRMDFPSGWKVFNQRQAVVGTNDNQNAYVMLSLAEEATPAAAENAFFAQQGMEQGKVWRKGYRYFEFTPPADASGASPAQARGTVGFFTHHNQVFRLLCSTSADRWGANRDRMQRSLASFRGLSDRMRLDVEPKTIRIVTLDRAMTLEQFNRRQPSTVDLEELAVLNGVDAAETLPAGMLVKQVVGEGAPE